jgi:gamma-glutamyltranspeptidase/glutathione hydrolase
MRRFGLRLSALAATIPLALAAAGCAPRPTGGAVSSAAPAATEAGLAILAAGGNAADAAVATALALAVVYPAAGNLGGGGFAVSLFKGEATALDFRETAPAAAARGMFLGPDGNPVPDASLVGPLAAGVPGSPAGLFELHRRLGRLPWRDVVAPAERLARGGFVVTPRLARAVADSQSLLARFPETAAVWLPGGRPPAEGSVVRVPALAATLAAYAERGPKALTTGAAAAAIEAASRRYGGVLTAEDLASYRPVWRDPIVFSAFGWEVAAMPLPSSGGIIVAQTLGILERVGWASIPRGSLERAHLLAEAWRRSYADRFLLGDPATTRATPAELLDPAWLARRASEIDTARATPSSKVGPWNGPVAEGNHTTHLSVVDGDGNAVSLTTTLNGSFGCGLLVPELGTLLNNEMDDFAVAPGRANLYGLVQGEANAVGPGKRMLSSMAPTVAWRGAEVLVLGSPGGSRIPTAVTQVFLDVIVDGDTLETAVERPRIHHQWLPDELAYEAGALDREQQAALSRRGHALRPVDRIGEVDVVRRRADGTFEAAADPRGPGASGTAR